MQTNKMLIGGIVGGITFFLLGWVLYGMLMMNFMMENSGSASGVTKEPMEMWALVVGNFALAFFFTYVFGMWAKMPTPMEGMKSGAMMGLLMSGSFDFMMYGTSNIMTLKGTIMDICVFTVMCALGAAVIAYMLGRGEKATATA